MAYEQENNKTARAESSPAGMTGLVDSVPIKKRDAEPKGQPYHHLPPSKQRKAVNFWARKAALRALPGHCARCGTPHTGPLKNCDRCRASQKAYKALMRRKSITKLIPHDYFVLIEALTRRVGSLEIAVASLQLTNRDKYKQGYQRGFKKGRNALTRNIEALRGEHDSFREGCETSLHELQQLSHVYEHTFSET